MAAGVIRNLTDFRQATSFQHPFYHPMDFQDMLTEDEEEDEDDEGEVQDVEEEGLEEGGNISCLTNSGSEDWGDVGSAPSPTETTRRLLHFTDLINSDIQRYFGRKNRDDDPDACDIYEDRVFQGKCGRERYYADLVKMAQAGGGISTGRKQEQELESPRSPQLCESDCKVLEALCNQESTQHLGPLAELFDYGLRRFVGPTGESKQARRQKGDKRQGQTLPMCRRRLPPSFWNEPTPTHTISMLGTSTTPDFSDLLANWTTDSSQVLETEYHSSKQAGAGWS